MRLFSILLCYGVDNVYLFFAEYYFFFMNLTLTVLGLNTPYEYGGRAVHALCLFDLLIGQKLNSLYFELKL